MRVGSREQPPADRFYGQRGSNNAYYEPISSKGAVYTPDKRDRGYDGASDYDYSAAKNPAHTPSKVTFTAAEHRNSYDHGARGTASNRYGYSERRPSYGAVPSTSAADRD